MNHTQRQGAGNFGICLGGLLTPFSLCLVLSLSLFLSFPFPLCLSVFPFPPFDFPSFLIFPLYSQFLFLSLLLHLSILMILVYMISFVSLLFFFYVHIFLLASPLLFSLSFLSILLLSFSLHPLHLHFDPPLSIPSSLHPLYILSFHYSYLSFNLFSPHFLSFYP